jgi:hypothetical protein
MARRTPKPQPARKPSAAERSTFTAPSLVAQAAHNRHGGAHGKTGRAYHRQQRQQFRRELERGAVDQ